MILDMCESFSVSYANFYMISCRQLLQILDLFSPTDICEHLSPIAIALAEDRVAQVRLEALKVVRISLSLFVSVLDLVDCLTVLSDACHFHWLCCAAYIDHYILKWFFSFA